ncbi:hypothetical protein PSTT_06965 [Puccinia striiformis]|uniref:Uncharacterized protein n=1 Tax=Puccinia striiformis TaxID=27350 RepID=A0A2S4VID6_9BASI|nr:hypothetical protein PSTT_06965 [Puccinia striiformis]
MSPRRQMSMVNNETHDRLQNQLDDLETKTVTSLQADVAQIGETVLGIKTQLEAAASLNVHTSTLSDLKAKVDQLGKAIVVAQVLPEIKTKVGQLTTDVMVLNQRQDRNAELNSQFQEMYNNLQNNRQVSIPSQEMTTGRDNMVNLQINAFKNSIEGIQGELVLINEKYAAENQKKLDMQQNKMNEIKDIGRQLSQQIFCIEKSTQENQHKLAGLYSEIELLVKDANPARNPKQAREQANFMDMQNNNFTAALESMKDWVLDTQEKQIQLIFEMAMRNSGELVKQRNELKLQEVARLSAYKAENQNSMRLMAERCEKSLETQQHHFSAALTAQNRELQPVIEQTHQNTSELAEQRREVTSLYNMKAMMERKMESLENADREIGAGLQKANSAINSLVQENQLITQRNECQTFSLSAPSKRRRAGRKHAGELAPKLEATKPHQDKTLSKQTTKTLAQCIVDPKDKVVRKLASRITDTLVADISNIGAIEDKAGA